MANILKYTGGNIAGLNPVQYVFSDEIASEAYTQSNLSVTLSLKSGKSWKYLYATPDSIQLESKEEMTPAGMKYSYQIKMLVPKDRNEVEAVLMDLNNRLLVLKVKDKNGVTRIFGTVLQPMRKLSKLSKPPTIEGYNGWEVIFQGEFSLPAFYDLSDTGAVPFPIPAS